MNVEPTVSVILPVWNGQRFLAEAIDSMTRQTLDAVEVLVVDDGSTDRTRPIALELARRDPRVLVIALAHAGLAHALNAGIQMARGRYLARMDADDISCPSRLEKQVAFLDADPGCVAVGCDLDVIDEAGEPIGALAFPREHREIVDALISRGALSLAHPAVVMRTDACLAVGGYRAVTFPGGETDLWLRLSSVGRLANLPEPLLRYRRHRDAAGVRDRAGQPANHLAAVNAARAEQGVEPLRLRRVSAPNPDATYHNDCARFALKAGKRGAAIRHAGASLASAPLQLEPFADLAACAMPTGALQQLVKFSAWIRARRS